MTSFANPLTPTELSIVELTSQGRSAKEVARLLDMAPRTVEKHVHHARLKLGATNRIQLIAIAVKHGLVD